MQGLSVAALDRQSRSERAGKKRRRRKPRTARVSRPKSRQAWLVNHTVPDPASPESTFIDRFKEEIAAESAVYQEGQNTLVGPGGSSFVSQRYSNHLPPLEVSSGQAATQLEEETLADLYKLVGIETTSIPERSRLPRLYFGSGVLPSITSTPDIYDSQGPQLNQSHDRLHLHTNTPVTTSVSVKPGALEKWLDDWLLQPENHYSEDNTADTEAHSSKDAVKVLMHIAKRTGWTPSHDASYPLSPPHSLSNTLSSNGTSCVNSEAVLPQKPDFVPQKVMQKYFLTPMFAHPDDHALFSRKHWKSGLKRHRNSNSAQEINQGVPKGNDTEQMSSYFGGTLVSEVGPTIKSHMLLPPSKFGIDINNPERLPTAPVLTSKTLTYPTHARMISRSGSLRSRLDSRLGTAFTSVSSNSDGVIGENREENEAEDPIQASIRCGIITKIGMYLLRCVVYLSGATGMEFNSMSKLSDSGETHSFLFPPGVTLSSALSTARELNKDSHQSDSQNRVLLVTLESAYRIFKKSKKSYRWANKKNTKILNGEKRVSNAGPLLFAAISPLASCGQHMKRAEPSKTHSTQPSQEGHDQSSMQDPIVFDEITGKSRVFDKRSAAPTSSRPQTTLGTSRARPSIIRPHTTKKDYRIPDKNQRTSQESRPASSTLSLSGMRAMAREQHGCTGGTVSQPVTNDEIFSTASPSVSLKMGIQVLSSEILPGKHMDKEGSLPDSDMKKGMETSATPFRYANENNEDMVSTSASQRKSRAVEISSRSIVHNSSVGTDFHITENSWSMGTSSSAIENVGLMVGCSYESDTSEESVSEMETSLTTNIQQLHFFGQKRVEDDHLASFDRVLSRSCQAVGIVHMKQDNARRMTPAFTYACVAVMEKSDETMQLYVELTLMVTNGSKPHTLKADVSGMTLARIMSNYPRPLPLTSDGNKGGPSIVSEVSKLVTVVETGETSHELVLKIPDLDLANENTCNKHDVETISIHSRPGSGKITRPNSRGSNRPSSCGSVRPSSRGSNRRRSQGNTTRASSRKGSSRPHSRDSSSRRRTFGKMSREERKKALAKKTFNKNVSALADRLCSYVGRSQPIWVSKGTNGQASSSYLAESIGTIPGYMSSSRKTTLPSALSSRTIGLSQRTQTKEDTIPSNLLDDSKSCKSTNTQTLNEENNRDSEPDGILCSICKKRLNTVQSIKMGMFSVPVCHECAPPTPITTPRGLQGAPIVYKSPGAIMLSGMEVELIVRAWGVGDSDGVRFEAHDVLSANRMYTLETSDAECLRIITSSLDSATKEILKSGRHAAEHLGSLEKYYERLTEAICFTPNPSDRRGKVLGFKRVRKPRPQKKKTRSKSPIRELARDDDGSLVSMESGSSPSSVRSERALRLLAHEEKLRSDTVTKYGPVHYKVNDLKLGGIICNVKVRCKIPTEAKSSHSREQSYKVSEDEAAEFVVYIQAVDEQLGEYALETTFAECYKELELRDKLPFANTRDLYTILPNVMRHLVWLESKSGTERRIKRLSLKRPGSRNTHIAKLRKSRSVSPVQRAGVSVRTPVKKQETKFRRKPLSRSQQNENRTRIASELKLEEGSRDRQFEEKFGPVQCTMSLKLSGIECAIFARFTSNTSERICFHAVDDQLKDYTLETSFTKCAERLKTKGILGKDEDCQSDMIASLAVKHLLWLDFISSTERRIKTLTLNRPFRRPRAHTYRKTRSMSPQRNVKNMDSKPGLGLVEARRILRQQASQEARARDEQARLELASSYGPIIYETKLKMANIEFNVSVRHHGLDAKELLFHAVDEYLTDYTFPCTIEGCLSTLAVRGYSTGDISSIQDLVPLVVGNLLWFENVDEKERRKKRLTLNRPAKAARRVASKRKHSLTSA